MSRTLYHERIDTHTINIMAEQVTDFVEVYVRSWTKRGMTPDVVIEERVMVDRRLIIDSRTAYSHNKADAWYIREGIRRFDELLAAHPTLAQQQAPRQEADDEMPTMP